MKYDDKSMDTYTGKSRFSAGDKLEMIFFDGFHCNGNEGNLNSCSNQGFGNHDCSHSEDVGVICSKQGGINTITMYMYMYIG